MLFSVEAGKHMVEAEYLPFKDNSNVGGLILILLPLVLKLGYASWQAGVIIHQCPTLR